MLKPIRYSRIGLAVGLAIVLAVAGCGKSAHDAAEAPPKAALQGDLDEASYKPAAAKALAQARQAVSDGALPEADVDAEAAKLEQLLAVADKLGGDKAALSEAELMSTLGALYARKAAFHAGQGQQASVYLAKGFRYLDRAVTKYPENITARVNRGMVSAKLPAFLNKSSVARDDLRFVLGRPEFAQLPPSLQTGLRAALADVERQLAQAAAQP